ncbi:hypothetical protein AVEN_117216-1 [Araneus ventricosus]|uniref:DUF4219 domain-containing protein n=1 Tax=Araneus ventricosus TaxID=182803 RepID=A0A4Y2AX86_ARAVE|nr:hypothetical protein AVEN_117216-1 [Araneus ventricosus]
MAEFTETRVFTVPKIGNFNYGSWKTDMKVLLMENGCWQFILGTEKPCIEGASDRDKLAFELRRKSSYRTIYMGVERKYQALIADTEDSNGSILVPRLGWETSLFPHVNIWKRWRLPTIDP